MVLLGSLTGLFRLYEDPAMFDPLFYFLLSCRTYRDPELFVKRLGFTPMDSILAGESSVGATYTKSQAYNAS